MAMLAGSALGTRVGGDVTRGWDGAALRAGGVAEMKSVVVVAVGVTVGKPVVPQGVYNH